MIDCTGEKQVSKEPPSYPYTYTYTPKPAYFEFNLYVEIEGIQYTIKKTSDSVSTFKSWKEKPEYDWRELKHKMITVYYSDKVKIATTFKDQNTKPTYFNLLFSTRSRKTFVGFILLVIMSVAVISYGGRFLYHSVLHIYKDFELPTTSSGSSILSLEYWNNIFVPSAVLVLAIFLVILLGLVLAKGMLFVESENAFISGLLLFIGAVISTFGPGLIVIGVYHLKVRTKKIVKAIKNLILLATLGKLVTNLIIFFFKYNFREFNEESIGKFLMQTISALIAV